MLIRRSGLGCVGWRGTREYFESFGLCWSGDKRGGARFAGVEALGFAAFAGGIAVSHAYAHIVEIGMPVEIAGLKIETGDLLHGDCHGVISIPTEIAAEVPAVAARMLAREKEVISLCKPDGNVRRIRSAIRKFRQHTCLNIMSRFSIRYPYLIIVICLMMCVVGVTSLVRMPVDLFPPIKIPVVVVATFYSGMPPEQIENDITGRFERLFTLAQRHRPHRVALAAGREPDQGLFPAGLQLRIRPSPASPIWPWPICAICRRARCRRWC